MITNLKILKTLSNPEGQKGDIALYEVLGEIIVKYTYKISFHFKYTSGSSGIAASFGEHQLLN